MWWKGAHIAYSCWRVFFFFFFFWRPEGKIITAMQIPHTTYMYIVSHLSTELIHLMFILGRVDIFPPPKNWTQDNIDDQTHKNTKQLICNNRWHLNVSKSRQDSYYLSPLQSYSCIGTQETRDTCGETVKAVSRWTLQLKTALMADLSTKDNSVQFTGSVWQAFNRDPSIEGHFPIKPW